MKTLDTNETVQPVRVEASRQAPSSTEAPKSQAEIGVAVLTGGFDRPYAFGLSMALSAKNIALDVIGSDEIDSPEMHTTPKLNFLNLRGSKKEAGFAQKISRVLGYYARLFRYSLTARPRIFHILWNDKFQYFDRTLLMLYYKLLGKKIVLTIHNVNAGKRDNNDSFLNRFTLKMQYSIADHLFVHTDKMKSELLQEFYVREEKITIIPFGINNAVPMTSLTHAEARQKLGIGLNEKTILFFGAIRPYKGLEFLLQAFTQAAPKHQDYKLIIGGEPKHVTEQYMGDIHQMLNSETNRGRIVSRLEFVPDEETEVYFKAADVLVLPYTHVFQSGVLSLAYSFGLPVIASDVGSLKEDIIEGSTGFVCKPCDPVDLTRVFDVYFDSPLYKNLQDRRQELQDYARAKYSWDVVGDMTRAVYTDLLAK